MAGSEQDKPGKSAAVRSLLEDNPRLTNAEIVAALAGKGLTITLPQVSSIKYQLKQRKKKARRGRAGGGNTKNVRTSRAYPAVAFKDATQIGEAIVTFAQGERIRRLTLLEKMGRAPTSGTTRTLITNSGKYGITVGSYVAEWLELTDDGKVACDA